MDGSTLLADTNAMTNSNSTKATLSTLAAEVLDRIFWLVDKPDLLNLRLVSKFICVIAERPFSVRHFANCHHVITKNSMQTLLAISEHKIFGPYIKTIMISPARTLIVRWANIDSSVDEDARDVVADYYFKSAKFKQLTRRIFSNLKRYANSIALAVHEDVYLLREDPGRFKHSIQCHGATELLQESPRGITFRTPETLQFIVAAMKTVGIGINSLDIELYRDSIGGGKRKTDQAIAQLLQSSMAPLDFHLRWDGSSMLEYTHRQDKLCVSQQSLITEQRQDRRNVFSDVLVLDAVVQWLTKTFSQKLCLRELCADRLYLLDAYFKRSLRSITLIDITLCSEHFADGVYSSLFKLLSELPDLKHCKLHKLQYGLVRREHPFGHTFRLPSRTYPTGWQCLLLFFPNGTSELEIAGSDVSKQLENLAAYTAAAELSKIEEVEAAKDVVNHRVIGVSVPVFKEDFPGDG